MEFGLAYGPAISPHFKIACIRTETLRGGSRNDQMSYQIEVYSSQTEILIDCNIIKKNYTHENFNNLFQMTFSGQRTMRETFTKEILDDITRNFHKVLPAYYITNGLQDCSEIQWINTRTYSLLVSPEIRKVSTLLLVLVCIYV